MPKKLFEKSIKQWFTISNSVSNCYIIHVCVFNVKYSCTDKQSLQSDTNSESFFNQFCAYFK